MTLELTILIYAALLQIATLCVAILCADLQIGLPKAMSPRDPEMLGKPIPDQVGTKTSRLIRAYQNQVESLPLFAIACVVITLSHQSTPFTQTCAWVYLGARIAYVPSYILGLVPWRSVIWCVSMAASTLILISTLL